MKTIYHQEKYKHVNVKRNQQIYASKKLKKKINAIVSHASELIAIFMNKCLNYTKMNFIKFNLTLTLSPLGPSRPGKPCNPWNKQ